MPSYPAIMRVDTKPTYVNHQSLAFKHSQLDLTVKVVSSWTTAEDSMLKNTKDLSLYFPPVVDLAHDEQLERRLAQDIQSWSFFPSFPPKLARLAINLSRICSFRSASLSYERRILLHHHVAWIFLMDHVTEKLPLYGLHDTAGRAYLDVLKDIAQGKATSVEQDLPPSCPKDLRECALAAQRILAEDLMPLKHKLLSPRHVRACIETLVQFFTFEDEEATKFCRENTTEEILQTRVITVGGILPMLLSMTSTEAEFYMVNDPGLIHHCMLMALINDIFGLHKDLESVQRQDDGSAYLNLVRVAMRDGGLTDRDAFRIYVKRLNYLTRSAEMLLSAFPPARRAYYVEALRLVFNYFDYHVVGMMENANNRYGWRLEQ